jgi:hypothetical protein
VDGAAFQVSDVVYSTAGRSNASKSGKKFLTVGYSAWQPLTFAVLQESTPITAGTNGMFHVLRVGCAGRESMKATVNGIRVTSGSTLGKTRRMGCAVGNPCELGSTDDW